MPMIPLSTTEVLASINESLEKILVESGGDMKRVSFDVVAQKIKTLLALDSTYVKTSALTNMYPELVKRVESVTQNNVEGILVTYWNDDADFIPAASTGGGFAADSVDFIKDEETGIVYFHMFDENRKDLIPPAPVPFSSGSGSGGTGSDFKFYNTLPSRKFSVNASDDTVMLEFYSSSVDSTDETPLTVTAVLTVNNSRVATGIPLVQGANTLNVAQYLTAGVQNEVTLTAEDAYGATRSLTYTITSVSYALTWNLDEIAVHGAAAVNLRMVPSGQGDKTVKVTVDNVEVFSQVVATSGRTVSTSIAAQSHGAHTIRAWMEATVDGELITTPVLEHVGVWTEAGNVNTIVALMADSWKVQQYGTWQGRFLVYNPNSETAEAHLLVDGEPAGTVTARRDVQIWPYRPTTSGDKIVAVESGGVTASHSLTVDPIGVDVKPVTNGLVVDLDPAGHSNAEAGRASWGYKDGNGLVHPMVFSSNFDWKNGGFRQDSKGITAFVVKRGTTVTFDRGLFADEAKSSGKNVKLIFKTENVRVRNTKIISCESGGIGMAVRSHSVTLNSGAGTAEYPYGEGRVIEMDLNIEPTSESRLALIHMKTIPSAGFQYAPTDTWRQDTPALLTIGSADCDVWIYRIKAYENNLTDQEILANYIADCVDPLEMLARAERNDIYTTSGVIDPAKLAQKNRKCRVVRIKAKRMTTSKEDEVLCDVEIVYEEGGEKHHLIIRNVTMKAQGTSSLEYILAALNLDLDFSTATYFVNGDGEAMTEYAMTANSIPVSYINLKANVASSENANNVCFVDDYNTFNPCKAPGYAQDPRIRDSVEGHPCAVFFENTADVAVDLGARTVQPGETVLYFAGDMNNSKKNYKVFGQNPDYDNEAGLQCCIEVTNNNNAECRFRKNIEDSEPFDDGGNFEFRYPKRAKAKQAMIDAFKEMHAWVVSTTRDLATNAPIAPVTYDGVIYSVDNAEYRAAKWKAELGNYFNVDSLVFHKLYVDNNLLIDNQAKNLFFSYEWDEDAGKYLWNVRCAYDMDTGAGNNNSGNLTFRHGLEDTDMIDDAYVFNASDSTIWVNIRDLNSAEMDAMYIRLKAQGAWSAARKTAKWESYQSARPEALMMEDARNKYILPLLLKGSAGYMPKMVGLKEDQRAEWFASQEVYDNTRHCDLTDLSDVIALRANTTSAADGDMYITYFSECYSVVRYGNAGVSRQRVTAPGQTVHVVCPANRMDNLEVYVFGASNITDPGDMSKMKVTLCEIPTAYRMQALRLGSSDPNYTNANFKAFNGGDNPMLEVVDFRGLVALAQMLDASGLTSLKELYATNSGLTGVTFAERCPLKIAYLPAVRQLIARELGEVETFVMSGQNVVRINVEDSPLIDTGAIMDDAQGVERGRLTGVAWNLHWPDAILRLISAKGIDAVGGDTEHFVLTGAAHIEELTDGELTTIQNAFPDLTVTYDRIVTAHTVTFQDHDGTVLDTQIVRDGSDAVNPVLKGITPSRASTAYYSYTFTGWSRLFNEVTEDITVTATYAQELRKYTVNFWRESTRATLLDSQTVDAGSAVKYGGVRPESDNGIFSGWSDTPERVLSDMDIYAVFSTPTQPLVVAGEGTYRYLYSDFSADNQAYNYGELMWILLKAPNPWNYVRLGDKIRYKIDSTEITDTEITFVACCKNHFKMSDPELAGEFADIVWLPENLLQSTYYMNSSASNIGGWGLPSAMWNYLHNKVMPALPYHLRYIMCQFKVRYLSVKDSTRATEYLERDSYMFTPSYREVGFNDYTNEIDSDVAAEDRVFSVFSDNNSRIRTFIGSATGQSWWLRTPYTTGTTNFYSVTAAGASNSNTASYAYGVLCGFCTRSDHQG